MKNFSNLSDSGALVKINSQYLYMILKIATLPFYRMGIKVKIKHLPFPKSKSIKKLGRTAKL